MFTGVMVESSLNCSLLVLILYPIIVKPGRIEILNEAGCPFFAGNAQISSFRFFLATVTVRPQPAPMGLPTRVDAKAFWHYKNPMKILWDEPKGLANLDKHKLDFSDLTLDFFIASVVIPAKNQRAKAVGRFGKRAIVVIFKNLGSEAISVVSMRPANPKEKRILQ